MELLERARDLIKDINNWVQRGFACNEYGHYVDTVSPDAVSFCALGALYRAGDMSSAFHFAHTKRTVTRAREMLDEEAREMGYPGIQSLNDFTDHRTVLAMYDRVITGCKRSEDEAAETAGACTGSDQGS